MTTLAVVEALRAEGVEALAARLSLQVRRHREHPSLVLLKYSMIDSPMGDPVVRQCRGIVVDEADGFRPVAYPFDKFFNYHEGNAAPIDWATARVFEKADGVLCTLYAYGGRWHVASAALPDAWGLLKRAGRSIAEAFWGVFHDQKYALPEGDGHCFMFELCLPSDPVLVRYAEPRLLLHGARDLRSLAEADHEPFAERHGWQAVRSLPARSLDEAVRAARALSPTAGEGFVARDGAFRRVKIKSPAFVALHHMRGATNLRHLLEVVRANEGDEFLAYFPEARPAWQALRERFDAFKRQAEADLAKGEGLDDRAFGLLTKQLPHGPMLFAVRKGKASSLGELLASCPVQALEKHLGLGKLARELGVPLEPGGRGPVDDA
jgi:RNA ligase-like protein